MPSSPPTAPTDSGPRVTAPGLAPAPRSPPGRSTTRAKVAEPFARAAAPAATPNPTLTQPVNPCGKEPVYDIYLIKLFPVDDVVHSCWVARLTVALVQRHVFVHQSLSALGIMLLNRSRNGVVLF